MGCRSANPKDPNPGWYQVRDRQTQRVFTVWACTAGRALDMVHDDRCLPKGRLEGLNTEPLVDYTPPVLSRRGSRNRFSSFGLERTKRLLSLHP